TTPATLNDAATLSGGFGPTGTITFNLYDPDQAGCTGTPRFTQTVTVNGNGTYSTTGGFPADKSGTWNWTATYSGDNNNAPAASNCGSEPVQITAGKGKVTGGGQVVPRQGGTASFGYIAQRKVDGGAATGHFNYVNHMSGLHINGPVNDLVILSPTS